MAVSTFVDAYLESSQLGSSIGELVKQWRGMKNNGLEIAQQFESLSKNLSDQLESAKQSILANLECDMQWVESIVEREQSDLEQLKMQIQLKGQTAGTDISENQSQNQGISQEVVLQLLKRVKAVDIQTNSLQISTLSSLYSKTIQLLLKKNARIKTNILTETPKFASDFKSYLQQVNSALQAYDVKSNLLQVKLQAEMFKQQPKRNQGLLLQKPYQQASTQQYPEEREQHDRLESFGAQSGLMQEEYQQSNSKPTSKTSTARSVSPLPAFARPTDKQPPELSPTQSFKDFGRSTSNQSNQQISVSNRSSRQGMAIPQQKDSIGQDMQLQDKGVSIQYAELKERDQTFTRSKSPVMQGEQSQQGYDNAKQSNGYSINPHQQQFFQQANQQQQQYQSVQASSNPSTGGARGRGSNTTPKKIFGAINGSATTATTLRTSTSQNKDSQMSLNRQQPQQQQQQEAYLTPQLQPAIGSTSNIKSETVIKRQIELGQNGNPAQLQSNYSSNNKDLKVTQSEFGNSVGQQQQQGFFSAVQPSNNNTIPQSIPNSQQRITFSRSNNNNTTSEVKTTQKETEGTGTGGNSNEVQFFTVGNSNSKNDKPLLPAVSASNTATNQYNTQDSNQQGNTTYNSIPSLCSPSPKLSVTTAGNQVQPSIASTKKKDSVIVGSSNNQKRNSNLSQQSQSSVTFQENDNISLIGHQNGVKCLEMFGTDRILSGGGDSFIKLWDRVDLKLVSQLEGHRKGVSVIKASQIHRAFASGDGEGTILIWRQSQQIQKTQTLKGHASSVTGIVFQNERRIASCSTDGYVIVWDFEQGTCISKLEQQKSILTSLEIHGNMLLGACDKYVLFYELAGYQLLKKVEAHDEQINQISLVIRGRAKQPFILTCSMDGCLYVWDGSDTYEEVDMIQEEGNNKWNIVCFEYCPAIDSLMYASNSKGIEQISRIHSYNMTTKVTVLVSDYTCKINALKVIGNELYVGLENNYIQTLLISKHSNNNNNSGKNNTNQQALQQQLK